MTSVVNATRSTIRSEAGWPPGPVWTGAKKSRPHRDFDPRTVQPLASHYNDYAIQAHNNNKNNNNLILILV